MWLVAFCAAHFGSDLRHIIRIHLVYDRVLFNRMTEAILDVQSRDRRKVGFRQLDLPTEDRRQVLALEFHRLGVRTVAFQAEAINTAGAKQLWVSSSVRLVASRTPLLKCWLVKMRFLMLFSLIGVAAQAHVHRIRLWKSGRLTSVRIVARGTVAGCAWMLHLCLLYLFSFVGMTGDAQFPCGVRG